MRCLVTGGAGFIGSNIAEALVKKGYDVRIIDDFSGGKESNFQTIKDRIEVIRGDIRNRNLVKEAMAGVDYVSHQAALKLVPDSFENPHEYNAVNIEGTLTLLEEARRAQVKKFVYASSSSVYGDSEELPKKESHVVNPISPYAVSKLAAENYCTTFTKNYEFPTVSLRYFNVFGPKQTVNDGYSNVIPKFIFCMLKNQSPPVYGDGKQSRDFTYIENVVNANIQAFEYQDVTGTFNVGMGERHDLLTIIDILNRLLNKKIKPEFFPPQKGDVRHTLASIELIQKRLGYRSTLIFEEGLKRTLGWFQKESC